MGFFKDKVAPLLAGKEGGYVDHPSDRGGPTNHGITERVARDYGYQGRMQDMPFATALRIYEQRYFYEPEFNLVANMSEPLALELIDTGVNMGLHWPGVFLQTALNRLNRRGKDYANVTVDGDVGPASRKALAAFLNLRGAAGEKVMLKALNVLQGARYFDIAPEDDQNEDFMFGWLANRVEL